MPKRKFKILNIKKRNKRLIFWFVIKVVLDIHIILDLEKNNPYTTNSKTELKIRCL